MESLIIVVTKRPDSVGTGYETTRNKGLLLLTGRIQFKVLLSCLAKSSDFGSALLKYYVNVQVFNFLLK